jgi:hypothetical protein
MADRTISDLIRTMRSFFRSEGGFEGKEITLPSNSQSGYQRIYPKSDGWYVLNSGGTENGLMYKSAFSGLNKITVGTSAPSSPSTGDLWLDTN